MKAELRERCARFSRWLINDRCLRPLTARGYVGYLGAYLEAAKSLNPPPEFAAAYRELLLDREQAASTTRNALAAIERYHEMIGTPVTLKKPRQRRSLPRFLTIEEVQQLLFACDDTRDYAILNTLIYGGLRASEVVNLNVGDWNSTDRTLTIRDGKGGKSRVVVVSAKATSAIDDWLQHHPTGRKVVMGAMEETPLFPSARGERIAYRQISRVVRRWARAAGLKRDFTAHTLRHTLATHALRGGMALTDLQAQLGHADAKTTLIYAHQVDAGRRQAYDRSIPQF